MLDTLSLGAVGAGVIAAVVSLLGLIISKENKTSDFRQSWIDEVRKEIGQFLVNFNALADASQAEYKDFGSRLDRMGPLTQRMNEAAFAIGLRLNPKEKESENVITAVNALQGMAESKGSIDPTDIRLLEAQLLATSSKLLKKEWKRVKRGEPIFFLLKYLLLVGLVMIFAVMAIGTKNVRYDVRDQREATRVEAILTPPPLTPHPNPPEGPSIRGGARATPIG